MGLLAWLFARSVTSGSTLEGVPAAERASPDINPATGLPMLDDVVDVMGNPYGLGELGSISHADDFSAGVSGDW